MRPVPEYDPKAWLLKALRETSHAMESLAWDLADDDLDRTPGDEEWSCARLCQHVAEMERRFFERLERMTQLDEPRIDAFDADSIAMDAPRVTPSVYETLDNFGELRRRTVYLLWSLEDRDWERRGVHPYLGPQSILQVAREMNEHDLSHLWQLRRLCDLFARAGV